MNGEGIGQVDSTGHRWFPRAGDLVRDQQSGHSGVVLEVRQHASAPAFARVALDVGADDWMTVELNPRQLERDTSGDVEVPALAAIEFTLEEAAARVLADVQVLGPLRARVQSSEELVAELEIEATRCLRVADATIAAHRYDLAARERDRAWELRELAAAVRTINQHMGYRP